MTVGNAVSQTLRVGRTGLPANRLSPCVGLAHRGPDDRLLGLDVGLAFVWFAELLGQGQFLFAITRSRIRVSTQIVAKEQGELLVPAPMLPHMDVRAPSARRLAKIPFGPLQVIDTEAVTEPLQWLPEKLLWLERLHRDLDVDYWLGDEAGNGGGANVVDPHGDRTEYISQRGSRLLEPGGPRRIVGHHHD